MTRRKQSAEERKARQRLRLVTPENAGKVVSRDIYWTRPFLDLYLEACDQHSFEDPQSGYLMALHAPSLARLIGVRSRPGEYRDETEKVSYEVLAIATLAGACRRTGRLSDAELHFEQAFRVADRATTASYAEAELYRRYATLRVQQKKSDAGDLVETALGCYDQADHEIGAAETLVVRGVHHGLHDRSAAAALDFARALHLASAKTDRSQRVFEAALINLTHEVVANSLSMRDQSSILDLVRAVRRRWGKRSKSAVKMKVHWIEGLLFRNLHFHPQARRLLERTRQGLKELGEWFDFALASLDLALVYLEVHDEGSYRRLADETLRTLRAEVDDQRLLDAMGSWNRRVLSAADLRKLRRTLADGTDTAR